MALEERQKLFVIITLILTLVALGLMVGSFATDNWIKATGNKNTTSNYNVSNVPSMNGSFGLFRGSRRINYGNGPRPHSIAVVCDSKYCILYNDKVGGIGSRKKLKAMVDLYTHNQTAGDTEMYQYGLFPFSLWVVVLVMSALGMIWGLVYIGFATFNICGKPIETITGPLGLFIWKGLALLFSLLAVVVYLVLYFQHYKKSVLPREDQHQGFVSHADLDFSFYMLMVAVILFFLNLILLCLSGLKFSCGFTREAEKVMDNGIILY
ncbi:clarin-1-like [Saccostrea cucullata]|uniref:clarin-1-like n=1 Tax=Saccostrea cuccullata TaxID=36930 RepID=UPI002ED359DC